MTTDIDIFFTIVSATLILLLLIFVIASLVLLYNGRQAAHKVELRRLRSDFEQELLKSQLEITEQTLQNVSREIHDNIGQMLSLANLMLSDRDPGVHTDSDRKVQTAMNLITSSIQSLRDLSRTLDSDLVAKTGLVNCIRTEMDLMEKSGKYKTTFTIEGDERELDGPLQLIVYRVVQESITNILKHAHANNVQVNITFLPNHMRIFIADNGAGFDPATLAYNGSGFRNMRHRMQLVKGNVEIESKQGEGTSIALHVPLQNDNKFTHGEI